jgi:hypothetical protein
MADPGTGLTLEIRTSSLCYHAIAFSRFLDPFALAQFGIVTHFEALLAFAAEKGGYKYAEICKFSTHS